MTASPALRLTGVASYEGAVAHSASADGLAAVHAHLAELRALALDLAERGHFDGLDQIIVTAGGSAFFDQVVEVLGEPWPLPVLPVLRSGAYLTHDEGYYERMSPLGAHPRIDGAAAAAGGAGVGTGDVPAGAEARVRHRRQTRPALRHRPAGSRAAPVRRRRPPRSPAAD